MDKMYSRVCVPIHAYNKAGADVNLKYFHRQRLGRTVQPPYLFRGYLLKDGNVGIGRRSSTSVVICPDIFHRNVRGFCTGVKRYNEDLVSITLYLPHPATFTFAASI